MLFSWNILTFSNIESFLVAGKISTAVTLQNPKSEIQASTLKWGAFLLKQYEYTWQIYKTLQKYLKRKRILISKNISCNLRWVPENTLSENAIEIFQITEEITFTSLTLQK